MTHKELIADNRMKKAKKRVEINASTMPIKVKCAWIIFITHYIYFDSPTSTSIVCVCVCVAIVRNN